MPAQYTPTNLKLCFPISSCGRSELPGPSAAAKDKKSQKISKEKSGTARALEISADFRATFGYSKRQRLGHIMIHLNIHIINTYYYDI